MAVKKLSDFKSRLLGGGARPNLFNVRIPDLPFATNWNATTQENFEFLCKASNLPAQNIASIDVPFRDSVCETLKYAILLIISLLVIVSSETITKNANRPRSVFKGNLNLLTCFQRD